MHSPTNTVDNNFISNLESTFSKSLHIQEAERSEHASEVDDYCGVVEGNLYGGIKQQETKLNKKCLRKSATFPYPDMMLPPSSSDEEDEEADISLTESLSEQSARQPYSRSVSLPTHLKLVSAMKGSREKQGESRMKLTVKWAPDVYDPVPTLSSHTVKSKKQQISRKKKSEKRNGKRGQKGNNSRGVSGKDKKQFHKLAGTSDAYYKSLDSRDKVIESYTEFDALDANQDSYCGTSFLKKSVTRVHYSVAAAQ